MRKRIYSYWAYTIKITEHMFLQFSEHTPLHIFLQLMRKRQYNYWAHAYTITEYMFFIISEHCYESYNYWAYSFTITEHTPLPLLRRAA